jgi:hypothetical protein
VNQKIKCNETSGVGQKTEVAKRKPLTPTQTELLEMLDGAKNDLIEMQKKATAAFQSLANFELQLAVLTLRVGAFSATYKKDIESVVDPRD